MIEVMFAIIVIGLVVVACYGIRAKVRARSQPPTLELPGASSHLVVPYLQREVHTDVHGNEVRCGDVVDVYLQNDSKPRQERVVVFGFTKTANDGGLHEGELWFAYVNIGGDNVSRHSGRGAFPLSMVRLERTA